MTGLGRSIVVIAVAVLVAGCGGSGSSFPRHGILFTYLTSGRPTWHPGGDIYSWTPGSVPRRIFRTGSPAVGPLWSPNGTRIVWSMVPPAVCKGEADECGKFGCEDQVYVSRGGSPPERVSPDYTDSSGNQGCSDAESWSPDGTQILIARSSSTAPTNLAILDPATGRVRPLHLPDVMGGSWGGPGIAYLYARTTRLKRPPYGHTTYEIRVVSPSPGGPRFVMPLSPRGTFSDLAWSSRGELATVQGHRVAIYSATGQKVADFTGPKYPAAPANGSGILWSPDGRRVLVCVDAFGGLPARERQKHVNTAAKRSHYPPLVSYVVDRDGTHWRRFDIPNPQRKESACAATSWR